MAALSNKDFKQGWIDSYYPYGEYIVQNNQLILGGEEIKVNREILTEQVIKESTSGYDKNTTIQQTGGSKEKKYKIKADNIKSAFKKLEGKIKEGKGDIIILKLESLDNKNRIYFYKIYKKNMSYNI
jgi:hypothetical protein